MRGRAGLFALLLWAGGCIDNLLETGSLPKGNLSVTLVPSGVAVAQGGEQLLSTTVNRFGNFEGPVTVAVVGASGGLPGGVTAEVSLGATVGTATTANILLRVAPDAALGTYSLRVRATGSEVAEASTSLTLTVTPQPDFSLATAATSLAIARGGLAPIGVTLSRTAFQGPVSLALSGAAGITATFSPNPALDVSATATVSVAAGVAPGAYAMTVEGTAPGLAPRPAALSVVVLADPLQLLLAPQLSSPQAGSVSLEFILNQGPGVGAVSLSVEGLPPGVAAAFAPGSLPGRRLMTLTVGPSVTSGSHPGLLRAVAPGVPDATAPFTLEVTPAGIAVSLSPSAVNLTAGGSATVQLMVVRTAYAGPVALAFEDLPTGITVTADPATVPASTTTLTISASAQAALGPAVITVRATPVGLAPDAVRTAALGIMVAPPLPGGGNVVLDWSGCTPPEWVAGQDGDGPWTQVLPQGGVYRFEVVTDRGGYAWVRGGNTVAVRYLTRAELTGPPLALCDAGPGSRTITGTGAHLTDLATPEWSYQLGGAGATSNGQARNFVLAGVRDGVHDLVAFGPGSTGFYRGLIQRDVDLPDGSSLGVVDLNGAGSFSRAEASFQISGAGLEPGGSLSASMHYLTTAACTSNLLHNFVILWGVPESLQRPDDYHMMTLRWNTATGAVIASEVFHRLAARTMGFPAALPVPVVATVPGAHARLQALLSSLPAVYNGGLELRYTDGGTRTMSVGASASALASTGLVLTMPDLAGISGWPGAAAIPSGSFGTWSLIAAGSSGAGALCAEGRRVVSGIRRGGF